MALKSHINIFLYIMYELKAYIIILYAIAFYTTSSIQKHKLTKDWHQISRAFSSISFLPKCFAISISSPCLFLAASNMYLLSQSWECNTLLPTICMGICLLVPYSTKSARKGLEACLTFEVHIYHKACHRSSKCPHSPPCTLSLNPSVLSRFPIFHLDFN